MLLSKNVSGLKPFNGTITNPDLKVGVTTAFFYLALAMMFLFVVACNTEPQPLVAGKDECYFCKMPVADTKFGAEIITVKGKLYKFDDTGCIINFLKIGLSADEKIKNIFTVCYSNNQKFLDVNKSFFLMSENFRTPMNSEIASFESRSEAETFLKKFAGEILTWQQLQQKLK